MRNLTWNRSKYVLATVASIVSLFDIAPANAAQLTLSWNKASDSRIAGYEIAYGTSSGSSNTLANAGNNASLTVNGLTEGRTYYFRVRSYNSNRTLISSFSNEVSWAMAAQPTPTPMPAAPGASMYGTSTGTAFADQLAAAQRLTRISVRAGWCIDGVQAESSTGPLPLHGGTGGNLNSFTLEADEYLVGLSGKFNKYVSQLTFRTSKGRNYGPYGDGRDPDGTNATASFDINASQGNELVVFTGRASGFLNAVGAGQRQRAAVVAPPPATPTPAPTPIPTAVPTPSPTPAAGTSSSPVYGSLTGTTFVDQAAAGQKLTAIAVRAGWSLDAVQAFINGSAQPLRGGTGGTQTTGNVASDDYLVSVSGKYGRYVTQLSFTSKQGKTFGPYGEGRDPDGTWSTNTFGYTVPTGTEIVGLTGRSSKFLDAIGVLYRSRSSVAAQQKQIEPTSTPINASNAVTEGLVAAYAFDETNGSNVVDSSGLEHEGTTSNTNRISQGRFGKAMAFTGDPSSYVAVADTAGLHLSNGMTLEAWVYRTSNKNGWGAVISKEMSDGVAYYLYGNTTNDGRPVSGIRSNSDYAELQGSSELPTNQWVHIAGTYDGSMQRLYVNGELVSSAPLSGLIDSSDGHLRIGGNWGGESFTGYIDEVRIYNRALGTDEVAADMNRPVSQRAKVDVIVGDSELGPTVDDVPAGRAVSFQTEAAKRSGTLSSISVYVPNGAAVNEVVAGIYQDTNNSPGQLIASGKLGLLSNGWNTVPVSTTQLQAGTKYWIALLSPAGSGTLQLRTSVGNGGSVQDSASANLTTLPSSWTSGVSDSNGPLSAYGSGF